MVPTRALPLMSHHVVTGVGHSGLMGAVLRLRRATAHGTAARLEEVMEHLRHGTSRVEFQDLPEPPI